jgi:hypothetical protein
MQTSGLVLDLYDDQKGEVFRGLYPTQDAIPDFIKSAHPLSGKERELLPDDVFALVLVDGDQKLRKFACTDAGNTALSLAYLEKNAGKLPVEAQKVAAENLIKAAEWYSLEVPEGVQKLAGLGNKALAAIAIPSYAGQFMGEVGPRMAAARMAGGNMMSPEQMTETVHSIKGAEAGILMSNQEKPAKTPDKTVIAKTASVGRLVSGHERHGDASKTELEQTTPVKGEQAKSLPQSKSLKPHVDVSGKESTKKAQAKTATRHALGDKYPLDSYTEVKLASAYFEQYGNRFSPEQRHEFCQNLSKRADELNIKVSYDVKKYGSSKYAPDHEIKIAMDSRRAVLSDAKFATVLTELENCRPALDPEAFCATLEEFDKVAGINFFYDGDVIDPYYSTFGFDKTAEEYSYNDGNDYITGEQLEVFGKVRHKQLVTSFGEEFAEEFRKDPVQIFKSMPRDQKRMILHMAVDNAPGSDVVP